LTEVVRISGLPGCGKTTRLMELVSEEAPAPTDFYYVTFSRAAVEETESELKQIYDADDDAVETAARTFHSLALKQVHDELIDDLGEQIISPESTPGLYERFAERWGLRFDRSAADPLRVDDTGGDVPDGNRLFDVHAQLRLRYIGPEKCRQQPVELPRGVERTIKMLKAWEKFKQAGRPEQGLRLFEHHDYVHECVERGYAPNADVLFIDEFQDLSPLEYKLYKNWRDSGQLHRIYIAGDANQSIYGSFRAARPEFFRETPVDREENLTASYRCPAEVVATARQILQTDFQARSGGGTVRKVSLPNTDTLATSVARAVDEHEAGDGNTLFLLARTNWQVAKLSKALRGAGIPHTRLGRRSSVWDDELGRLLYALRGLRDDTPILAKGAKKLLTTAQGQRQRMFGDDDAAMDWAGVALQDAALDAADVWSAFPDARNAAEVIDLLDVSEWRADELHAALGRTDKIDPADVKIGTIHAAKGLEAPAVMLFAESSPQVLEAYHNGHAAEEHRLYYVGATRASASLHIVEDFFDADPFPLFETFTQPDDVSEVVA
jgi:superfamily I DNA/RNA helicase